MNQSKFVSIITVDGIVVDIEGHYLPTNSSALKSLFSGVVEAQGQKTNDMLSICAQAGYEHFFTETIGEKVIYRLKLVSRK